MKEHGSTLEETRADLYALYFLADPKLVELGILDNPEAYKAEYYKFIMNVTVPAGSTVTVYLPDGEVVELCSGAHELKRKWKE